MCTQENDTKRFAFYQAGKCLVQTLLLHHPKISILKITEPSNDIEPLNNAVSFSTDLSLIESFTFLNDNGEHAKTERSRAKTDRAHAKTDRGPRRSFLQGRDVLQTAGSKINSSLLTTITLETLLIGFYAGKAGEFFIHDASEPGPCKNEAGLQNEAARAQTRFPPVTKSPAFAKAKAFARAKPRFATPTSFLYAPVGQAAKLYARPGFVSDGALCNRRGQDSVISLLDYNKLTFTKKQRKNIIRLIERRGCRQNKKKLGLQNDVLHAKAKLLQSAQSSAFVFVKSPAVAKSPAFAKAKAFARAKLRFATPAPFLNGPGFAKHKNKVGLFTNGLQKRRFCTAFMALRKHQLQHEHYYPVLAPLNYFVFTNRLNCTRINHLLCQSDMGSLERVKAASLAKYLLINGSIYSPNFFNLQKNCKVGNLNKIEISDSKVFDFFTNLKKRLTNVFFQEIKKSSSLLQDKLLTDLNVYSSVSPLAQTSFVHAPAFYKKDEFVNKEINLLSQKKEISAWCEEKVCKALMFSTKSYGHWFRIYLPQIETHQRQPISRDQFFKVRFELELFVYDLDNVTYTQIPAFLIRGTQKHNKADTSGVAKRSLQKRRFCTAFICASPGSFVQAAKPLHSYTPLRLVQEVEKDLIAKHSFGRERYFETHLLPQEFGYGMCHNLIVNTFSQALNVIGKNRELLDIVTDHLIRFEKIRVPDVLRICLLYVDDNSFI